MRVFILIIFLTLMNSLVFALDLPTIPRNNLDFISKYRFTLPLAQKEKTDEKKKQESSNIDVSGIIKIDNDYVAIINGKSYKINNYVEDFKIVYIDMEKVVLEKNKKKVEIYVGKK